MRQGKQQILLQHEGDVGIGAFHPFAVDKGRAFARLAQTRADIEERALAAAARADERDDFAVADRKAHALDRGKHALAAGLGETHRHVAVFEAYNVGHRRSTTKAVCSGRLLAYRRPAR